MSGLDEIKSLLAVWPNAEWGPAHIVVSDHNLEDEYLASCVKSLEFAIREIESGGNTKPTHSIFELRSTLHTIRELQAMPEGVRFAGTHLDESEADDNA